MAESGEDRLGAIERSQAALRDSIAQAEALARESEERMRRSREAPPEPEPGPPL